jgi:hypothetical protein
LFGKKGKYQTGATMIGSASKVAITSRLQEKELLSLVHLIVKAEHFLRKAYQLRVHPSEAP